MTAAAVQPEKETTSTAVARRPSQVSLLRPIAPAADVILAQNETRELIARALQKGRDYGEIPGTNKPTLFKAGAERVALAFGCFAQFRTLETEVDHDREIKYLKKSKVWNNKFRGDRTFTWKEEAGVSLGLYRYVVECQIVNRDSGEVVGAFIGSCSSLESKYIDRPRDVENTIIKMAEKRALVGAALTTFGLSDQFTQDVEDLADNRTAADEEVVDQPEIVKDLAWAKAFGLPWPKHKHFGQPIDLRSTEELESALKWAKDKIDGAAAEGRELAPNDMLMEFREALQLVLADRKEQVEKNQTKLDLDQPKTETPASTSVKMPPPGKVADALEPNAVDPTSKKGFHDRIKKALESPAIDVEIRDAYHRDNINGFKRPGKTLEWWAKRLEDLAANDAESFPNALKDDAAPGKDGLPF
jgi:hypothetical protein